MTDARTMPLRTGDAPPRIVRAFLSFLASAVWWVCKGLFTLVRWVLYWARTLVLALLVTLDYCLRGLIMAVAALPCKKPRRAPAPGQPAPVEHAPKPARAAAGRHPALARLRRKLEAIERRAEEAERISTAKEFDWEQRLLR